MRTLAIESPEHWSRLAPRGRRHALWLNALRRARGLPERPVADTRAMKEHAYDTLARAMEEHLDVRFILELMGLTA